MAEFRTPIKKTKAVDADKITIPPSPFLNRLGYGTGVNVMQLVRSPRAGQIRSPWALKMLNKRVKPSRVYSERIQAEADLLKRMSHPNIVGFRAFSKDKILYLGMEACDISLGDMIEKRLEEDLQPFSARQMLKVAADIGSALDYLHTKIQILHGDMKSYNILVNGDFVICKLCDFGVTVPLDENGVFDKKTAGKAMYFGTEAWSAPEVLHGGQITTKTDIWPLGLTLWEMMALMPPHSQPDDDDETLDESGTSLDDTVDSMEDPFTYRYGTRPPIPANISEEQYCEPLALFYCCTETAPRRRPAARQVAAAAGDVLAGDVLAGDVLAGDVLAGDVLAGDVLAGDVLAGDVLAGDVLAGDVLAGDVLAGDVLAGDVLAGDVLAGDVLAGDVLAGAGL